MAYDPKVEHVADEFGQPKLIMTKTETPDIRLQQWTTTVRAALDHRQALSERARAAAEAAAAKACQNFDILAKILTKQANN